MAKSNSKDATAMFDGAGQAVEEKRGIPWPSSDPRKGRGVAGRVVEYRTIKSKHKDKPDYTLCLLDNAVIFEPTENGGELVRVGDVAVLVSAWIARSLTAARFPAGALVKLKFEGMQGSAKEITLYTLSAEGMRAIYDAARDMEDGEYSADAKSDDLPF